MKKIATELILIRIFASCSGMKVIRTLVLNNCYCQPFKIGSLILIG